MRLFSVCQSLPRSPPISPLPSAPSPPSGLSCFHPPATPALLFVVSYLLARLCLQCCLKGIRW